jgi:SAM-dependent methyltransferase
MSDQVADLWSTLQQQRQNEFPVLGWLDSPMVQRMYVLPKIVGATDGNWLVWLVDHLGLPRDGRWLSVACGAGGLELYAVEQGLCAQIEGVDIAPGAIEIARRNAEAAGRAHVVSYRVADLERERLPEAAYDVILCGMGLHHISRLEHFYEEAAQALRPGGHILLNEFVGPSQWQWSDAQLAAANALLAALPERYRRNLVTGQLKGREERPSLEWMNAVDPSESIRSAELLPLLERQFDIAARRDYGGALLGRLLEFIVGNFDPARQEDVELLRLLCGAEEALMGAGAIGSDFAVAAARAGRSLRASSLPLDGGLARHALYGLLPVERTPEGQPFCWTEPEAAFVLRRPPGAKALRLRLSLPPAERTLSVEVDGRAAGALRSRPRRDVPPPIDVAFALPASTRAQPTVTLRLDHGWSPAEAMGAPDDRVLGVALAEAVLR